MMEPEVAYLQLDGVMDLAEEMILCGGRAGARAAEDRARVLERDTTALERVKKPFPRITYREAIDILHRAGKETPYGEDFGGEDETVISEAFDRPVMIHRYPAAIKAFYMSRDPRTRAWPCAWT